MTSVQHVVWDWNGTLYADLDVTVDAVNHVMSALGVERTYTADDYRRHYRRPVRLFYEALAERPIDEAEWQAIDGVWHRHYAANHARSDLAPDAREALDRVAASERTQSLLSMWQHDQLVPLVDEYGLTGYFRLVDGVRGERGGRKVEHLRNHLAQLGIDDPATVLVVGDALDDGLAAREVGCNAILYDGGSHLRSQLDAFDAPVAESLLEALDLGGVPPESLDGRRHVRAATPDDAGAIADVHVRAWQVAYRGQLPDEWLDGLSVEQRAVRWRRYLSGEVDADLEPIVLVEEHVTDGITGFVALGRSRDDDADDHTGEVQAIYVRPDHWSNGSGTALLAAAHRRMRDDGRTHATLWVLDTNERAKRFYERHGWDPDGTTRIDDSDDVPLTEVRYATRFDEPIHARRRAER